MAKKLFSSLVFTLVCTSLCAQPKAKNVIFMIGDGMGFNQVYAALTANGGTLNMAQMPVTGYSKTYSASDYITDSAAGGTALATGSKTNNGMVGLAPDSVTPLYSSLYYAEQAGKSTGIIVTCPLTHATPAAFYAHQISRSMYEEIALDMVQANIDVMIGGGRKHLEKRDDKQNLTEQFRAQGYEVVYKQKDLAAAEGDKILAPLADKNMPKAGKRGDYLPVATQKAIDVLSRNEEGFFLMVEGSQIDYECHSNDEDGMVLEALDFDRAVGIALEFARRDGNTLVIVTADHETGAMSIMDGDYEKGEVKCKYNAVHHSGTCVPVMAFGPGAERFMGWHENTDYRNIVLELMGVEVK